MPEAKREYQSKTELALEMLKGDQARGHLQAQWIAGDSAFGMPPTLWEGLSAHGMHYVLGARPDLMVWAVEPTWTKLAYQGRGQPRKPQPLREARQTMAQRSAALPAEAWREITIAARAARGRAPASSAPSGCG